MCAFLRPRNCEDQRVPGLGRMAPPAGFGISVAFRVAGGASSESIGVPRVNWASMVRIVWVALLAPRTADLTAICAGNVPPYCVAAEFIGTFLFQFIGGGCAANSISTGWRPAPNCKPVIPVLSAVGWIAHVPLLGRGADTIPALEGLATAALGNGLALVVLVYATAGISGGHLNPAVSTAFLVTGRSAALLPKPCRGGGRKTRLAQRGQRAVAQLRCRRT